MSKSRCALRTTGIYANSLEAVAPHGKSAHQGTYFMPNLTLASFWQVSFGTPAKASQRSLAAL